MVIGLSLLLLGAAALAVWWTTRGNGALVLPGIVEVQEVRLGSKVGGRVARLLVEEGDQVKPGDVLLVFEAPELENQRTQVQARLAQAQADLDRLVSGTRAEEDAAKAVEAAANARYMKLKEGWRTEEKDVARSDLKIAESEFEQAETDYQRVSRLYAQRAISRAEYDTARTAYDRTRGQLRSARARYHMIVEIGSRKEDIEEARAEWEKARAKKEELFYTRPEEIKLAQAKVAEARAKLEEVEINLREAVVKVPPELGNATVEVIAVRPGDLVPANQPVARLLRAKDLWVKVFVPETQYGLVTLHKEVQVRIDTFPDTPFRGVVVQRANISEFTPRNVQSVDERRYQVFGVKIRVDDPRGHFNAGMAAEVTIPRD